MTIYIGADHNGFALKGELIAFLEREGYTVVDEGNTVLDPVDDFPGFAAKVATAVRSDASGQSRGILLCGSGQGVCIAANRFSGIRACVCADTMQAVASRNDDNANVLCLPARYISREDAVVVVRAWLKTPFDGAERFKRRIQQLDAFEV